MSKLPKKFDWDKFASSYSVYVGPDAGPDGFPAEDDVNASFYTFEIESRRHDHSAWAVLKHGCVLDKKENNFCYEPMSSHRDEDFFERCRFKTKEEAFEALRAYLDEWEPFGGGWIKKKDRPKIEKAMKRKQEGK